jgi:hypothetical protein
MKKILAGIFVFMASAIFAVAAPGTVVKVTASSITVHWTVDTSGKISAHGMAGGGYRGSSREYTFTVTPKTVYLINGRKGSLGDIQKGAHVNVKHNGLVATEIDVVS